MNTCLLPKSCPDLPGQFSVNLPTTFYRLFPERIIKMHDERGLLVTPLGLPPGLVELASHYNEPDAANHPFAVITTTCLDDGLARILSYNRQGWMDEDEHEVIRLHGGMEWLKKA